MRQRPDPLYYFRTLRFSREARYARQEKTALWSAYPARYRLPVQGLGEWPMPAARGQEHGAENARGKVKALKNLKQYRSLTPSQGVYEVLDLLERKGYTPATGGVNKPGR